MRSKDHEIGWVPSHDGLELGFRVWEGRPDQAVIVYLHGIEGHSLWFDRTAVSLRKFGITTYAPDRRGAGMNRRERGHLSSYQDFISDVSAFLAAVRTAHPRQPLILWGNCWGAKAASMLACHSDELGLSGIIFSSPAIETRVDLDLATKVSIASELASGNPGRRKWPIPLTPSMFTDSPEYLKFVRQDPMRITEATTSFYLQSHILSQLAKGTASKIHCPVLILQAGEDSIVDVLGLERWYTRIASRDKSMRIFPQAAHSLDFDEKWFDEYVQMAHQWILSHSREQI